MMNGGRRIATATGAMLSDPACLGNLPRDAAEAQFDPEFWRARGELSAAIGGRGSAWFIGAGERQWVLRHYRRGGFIARWSRDVYVWMGEDRVRAFAEWRLLEFMRQRGLPVPKPVAARYGRAGMCYRCDLITERIADAEPLSSALANGALEEPAWRAVGAAVARLHRAGVDHADLNAHNILLDPKGAVSVIDFDRGRLHTAGALRGPGASRTPSASGGQATLSAPGGQATFSAPGASSAQATRGASGLPGGWTGRNLRRLRRSLDKISRGLPAGRYTAQDWERLMEGYRAELGDSAEGDGNAEAGSNAQPGGNAQPGSSLRPGGTAQSGSSLRPGGTAQSGSSAQSGGNAR